jgi:hypothetical protein
LKLIKLLNYNFGTHCAIKRDLSNKNNKDTCFPETKSIKEKKSTVTTNEPNNPGSSTYRFCTFRRDLHHFIGIGSFKLSLLQLYPLHIGTVQEILFGTLTRLKQVKERAHSTDTLV